MPKIVISYRRLDSADITGRIFDRLQAHYGPDTVFMDIDSIPFGVDFRDYLGKTLAGTDILLAIIGPQWAGDGARRRIDDANDFVRLEIEAALKRDIPVVPVLVNHATMPSPGSLPESLANLAFRNAAEVDSGRDFHQQVDRLIRSMDRLLASQGIQIGEMGLKSRDDFFQLTDVHGDPTVTKSTVILNDMMHGRRVPRKHLSPKSIISTMIFSLLSGSILGYGAMALAAYLIYLCFGRGISHHLWAFTLTSVIIFYSLFWISLQVLVTRLEFGRDNMVIVGLCWVVLAAIFYITVGSGAPDNGALALGLTAAAEAAAPFIAAAFLPPVRGGA